MAKHPVPKYKKSKSRTKKRHSAWESNLAKYWEDKSKVEICPECGKKRLSHTVCLHCGKHKGKVFVNKDKTSESVKVVKA